jgi:hypothetical protein
MKDGARRRLPSRSAVQTITAVIAGLFFIRGILGLAVEMMSPRPPPSESGVRAASFSIAEVSALPDVALIGFGVLGLIAARTPGSARSFLVDGGIAYLIAFLGWRVIQPDRVLAFATTTSHVLIDDVGGWLGLASAVAMVNVGALVGRPTPDGNAVDTRDTSSEGDEPPP